MSNVFLFVPKAQVTSRQNLEEFILMCRDRLTVFGDDLDWYSHAWPGVGNFTKKGAPSRGFTQGQLMTLRSFLSLKHTSATNKDITLAN